MTDVHSAAGSYAVDALSPAERDEFEGHLVGCFSCRREVGAFAETLAQLTPMVEAAPPVDLRASVLASVAGVRQAPRLATRARKDVRTVAENGREAAPRRALPAQVTELRPLRPEEVAPLEEHPSVVPDTPWLEVTAALSADPPPPRRRDRLFGVLVAAALVVVVGLSGWVWVSSERNQAYVAEAQREEDLLTAPDAQVFATTVDGAPVSFVVSRKRHEALFIGKGLARPGSGRTYQLWILEGTKAVKAGYVRDGGGVREWFDRLTPNADGLALSREPSAGSTTPTKGQILAKASFAR